MIAYSLRLDGLELQLTAMEDFVKKTNPRSQQTSVMKMIIANKIRMEAEQEQDNGDLRNMVQKAPSGNLILVHAWWT